MDEMNKSLSMMQDIVADINRKNGWFDLDRTFGDDMALLHSEVSEAFEAYRKHNTSDITKELCDKETTDGFHIDHICKPEGVGSELADVLVRLLDTCHRYNVDLESEFNRKVNYNMTRGYRHGNRLV